MSILNLLQKFDQVKIENTDRISEADARFCKGHQEAYEISLAYYTKASKAHETAWRMQYDALQKADSESHSDYIGSETSGFYDSIMSCHTTFISRIVRYFEKTYSVKLELEEIKKALMPEEPERGWRAKKEKTEAYEERIRTLVLRYEDVVDQVIARLDGYSFTEKALAEIVDACRDAVYNKPHSCWNISIKGRTLSVDSYGCKRPSWVDRYEVCEKYWPLFKALCYDELGAYEMPSSVQNFLWNGSEEQKVSFDCLKKLDCIQFFKNTRLDFKFHTASDALAFAETYLGYASEAVA